MKGIDAAVATILLLMITISLVGFAFVWFNRLSKSVAKNIENQTLQNINTQAIRVMIVSAKDTNVAVTNTGSVPIPANSLSIVMNGRVIGQNSAEIAPSGTASIGLSESCSGNEIIAVAGSYSTQPFPCE